MRQDARPEIFRLAAELMASYGEYSRAGACDSLLGASRILDIPPHFCGGAQDCQSFFYDYMTDRPEGMGCSSGYWFGATAHLPSKGFCDFWLGFKMRRVRAARAHRVLALLMCAEILENP